MTANYHTHTWRCNHADGTEREYIEAAISEGLRILGFSDHTPYPFPDGHRSRMRMYGDRLEGYVDTLLALKEEYKNEIEIHIGLETEYFPSLFDDLRKMLEPYPVEYMILGQHFLDSEISGGWTGYPSDSEKDFTHFVRQTVEGMETGVFTYVAHPDIFNYIGNDSGLYTRLMGEICDAALRLDLPLEFNIHGYQYERNYPSKVFWRLAAERGCTAVIGIDAHKEAEMHASVYVGEAYSYLEGLGMTVIDAIDLPPRTF